jgi:hypothetical protein
VPSFVYKWTDYQDPNDLRYYIGSRKGSIDNYICSQKNFNEIYDSRPQDFIREILFEFDSYPEAREKEYELLREVDAARNYQYYNRHNGGREFNTPQHLPEITKKKMSDAHKKKLEKKKRCHI